MKAILFKDRFSAGSVLRDMISAIGGLELSATVAGADLARTWLTTHANAWQLAVVTVERDSAQMEIIALARALHPAGRIVAFGSSICDAVSSQCLRCGADVAFGSSRIGDLASWLDQLSGSSS